MKEKISIALEEDLIITMMGSLDPRTTKTRSELAFQAAKRFLQRPKDMP